MFSTMKQETLGSYKGFVLRVSQSSDQNNWREASLKHGNCLPYDNVNDNNDLYCTAGT